MEEMTGLLAQYGLALVFANVLLTQLGLPVPAIPTLIVAGLLAQQNQLSAAAVLAVAVAASLLGDLPWFVAGRAFGHRVLNALCRVAIEPDSCVKQTSTRALQRRAGSIHAVFPGRCRWTSTSRNACCRRWRLARRS